VHVGYFLFAVGVLPPFGALPELYFQGCGAEDYRISCVNIFLYFLFIFIYQQK
jgi:hypothetical protein